MAELYNAAYGRRNPERAAIYCQEAAQPGLAADGIVARLRLALAPAAEHRHANNDMQWASHLFE
jgi:hypothetical protein